jgi:hypothetical protein
VRLDATGEASVIEPEVLTRLHVEVKGMGPIELGSIGALDDDGEHAWLFVEELRALALTTGLPAGWGGDFDNMLRFATSKGWVDDGRGAIRAHIERG